MIFQIFGSKFQPGKGPYTKPESNLKEKPFQTRILGYLGMFLIPFGVIILNLEKKSSTGYQVQEFISKTWILLCSGSCEPCSNQIPWVFPEFSKSQSFPRVVTSRCPSGPWVHRTMRRYPQVLALGSGLPDPQGALYEPISGPKKPFKEYIDY